MKRKLSPQNLKRILNWWPPYLGSGIKVLSISSEWDYAKIKLKKGWFNTNYFGTAYGGSLFSMTDPFYMLMLVNRLGNDYIVWDKSASIKFISPGKSDVFCEFILSTEQVNKIKHQADRNEKYEPEFEIDIIDTSGNLIAKVFKKLHVKRKAKSSTQRFNNNLLNCLDTKHIWRRQDL